MEKKIISKVEKRITIEDSDSDFYLEITFTTNRVSQNLSILWGTWEELGVLLKDEINILFTGDVYLGCSVENSILQSKELLQRKLCDFSELN